MLIDFNDFFPRSLLNNKYLKPIFKKNLYLFLLGFCTSVGDLKLILATITFALFIVASYQLKPKKLYYYFYHFWRKLSPENKQFISPILIASASAILVYFSLSIYHELNHGGLALFVILQTIFSALGILFWGKQLFVSPSKPSGKTQRNFDDLVQDLNHDSPLHRLWVINQIMNLWQTHQLTAIQITQLEEYLILCKKFELEPVILAKIDDSLEKLSSTNSQPLNLPRKIYHPNQKNSLPVMQTVKLVKDK